MAALTLARHGRDFIHFEQRLAARFGHGRVWLAGDAAHTAAPAGVLSMNLGMQEAAELAQALSQNQGPMLEETCGPRRDQIADRIDELKRGDHSTSPDADWMRRHRSQIINSLPVTGTDLHKILQQLHSTRPPSSAEPELFRFQALSGGHGPRPPAA
ncbi:MAG: FAD-dependent oxidoreductase [Opitutales bacterium]